mgnify:CR=1 FL=1
MKEKVLITGARGAVAKKLSYLLDEEKYSIFYLTTNKNCRKNNEFYWNLCDNKIDPLALKNVNHIIHLSGYNISHSWTSKNKKIMFDSRVKTAKLIYNECYSMNIKPQTFITASAMGYYGFESSGMKKENDTAGEDWMAQLCVEWEKTANKFKTLGVRIIKLRLSLVLDKDSGVLNKILLGYKFGVGVVFGNGTQPFPWIHIKDVTRFIIFSMKEKNIDEAILIYETLINTPSPPLETYYFHSVALVQIQDWESAIRSLDVLIEKIPNNAEVLNFVGYILVDKSDRIKEGLGYIERAIELDSQNGFFLDSLGWAYYKLQKIDKAIYYLERAVELEPQEAEITSHLGDAYWQNKRYKEAMVQWKRALTLNGIDTLQKEIKSKLQRSINE